MLTSDSSPDSSTSRVGNLCFNSQIFAVFMWMGFIDRLVEGTLFFLLTFLFQRTELNYRIGLLPLTVLLSFTVLHLIFDDNVATRFSHCSFRNLDSQFFHTLRKCHILYSSWSFLGLKLPWNVYRISLLFKGVFSSPRLGVALQISFERQPYWSNSAKEQL